MSKAICLATRAGELGEIPVGAVIASGGEIVGCGYNVRESGGDPLGHAEINAIRSACSLRGDRFLRGCAIYVTLEPCPMCAGAILESGISRIVFGASDFKYGACGGLMNVIDYPGSPKRAVVKGGVMEKECRELLQNFFKRIRKDKWRDG